jgi:hypothetical protein
MFNFQAKEKSESNESISWTSKGSSMEDENYHSQSEDFESSAPKKVTTTT